MKKKVLIIYTGGTIGMCKKENGYAPKEGFFQKLLEKKIPELKDPHLPKIEILEYNPLLDSSDIKPENWIKIAKDIFAHYKEFDGFVILHGTDTLAYTASALSFLLHGLDKPVILTGSQVPLVETRNDARENLISSLVLSTCYPIYEVCICFGNKLLRGCRATKVDAQSFDAFDSPNFPLLAKVGVEIVLNEQVLNRKESQYFKLLLDQLKSEKLAIVPLFPGISPDVIYSLCDAEIKGIILESFGTGNGPGQDKMFLEAIKAGVDKGIVFVNRTQCLKGRVMAEEYASGRALIDAGVINGKDMTREALVAKMMCLFQLGFSCEDFKKEIIKNWCGEIST